MILFIDACVRSDSRTQRLAQALLEHLGGTFETIRLEKVDFPITNEAFLHHRDELIAGGRFDDSMFDMGRQFASADTIVIAAPYWDMSFPASLKQYVEQINVVGLTFEYLPNGTPKGLCKATRLYYVTTGGGNVCPEDFGYGYIEALSHSFYGISETKLISAYGLDIYGNDPEAIISKAINDIELNL